MNNLIIIIISARNYGREKRKHEQTNGPNGGAASKRDAERAPRSSHPAGMRGLCLVPLLRILLACDGLTEKK